jgi:hypothetical protein
MWLVMLIIFKLTSNKLQFCNYHYIILVVGEFVVGSVVVGESDVGIVVVGDADINNINS